MMTSKEQMKLVILLSTLQDMAQMKTHKSQQEMAKNLDKQIGFQTIHQMVVTY